MNEKELIEALLMHQSATKVESRLLSSLGDNNPDSWYLIRTRVKPHRKLVDKVEVKRRWEKKPDYQLRHITDTLGLRIVTLLEVQLIEALNDLINVLKTNSANIFKQKPIEECLVYMASSDKRAWAEELCEIVRNSKLTEKGAKIKPSKSDQRYSSIHLIIRSTEYSDKDVMAGWSVPIEVQIRTSLEDWWAEIDHFRYDINQGKNGENPKTLNSSFFGQQLIVLKHYLEAAQEHADTIYTQSQSEIKQESPYENINISKNLFDEEENIQEVKDFLLLAKTCDEKYQSNQKVDNATLEKLKLLKRKIEGNKDVAEEHKDILSRLSYFIDMEIAFSQLRSNSVKLTNSAAATYLQKIRQNNADSVAHYRLAQAYLKLKKTKQAIRHFRKSVEILNDEQASPPPLFRTINPNTLNFYAHKSLGGQLWLQAQGLHKRSKKKHLEESIELANKAIEIFDHIASESFSRSKKQERLGILNDLLYYKIELFKLSNTEKTRSSCQKSLKQMASEYPLEEISNLLVLDTLAFYYDTFNDLENTCKTAQKILQIYYDEESEKSARKSKSNKDGSERIRDNAVKILARCLSSDSGP